MHSTGPDPLPPNPAQAPTLDERLCLLVVDDDELDRRSVRRLLHHTGLCDRVVEATSAGEALECIRSAAYDCILLDYYIPGGEGVGALRQIQGISPDLPVVMFTGRGDEEIAVELMKAGAADYLPKASLDASRLASSIRHAMQIRRAAVARRSAEEQLRLQEKRFRTLANAIPQFAWIADPDGVQWYNSRWYEYTGATESDLKAWGGLDFVHPDHVERVREGLQTSMAAGALWDDTFPIRRRDGAYRWFLSRALPIREGEEVASWLGTNTDVTDQKAAQAERERLLALEREARTEAEQAVRARDEVLAFVAHDLNNPLTVIEAMSSSMAAPGGEQTRARDVEMIQRATVEMKRLIGDLLDVARIESGRFAVRPSRLEVAPMLHEVRDLFECQAESRSVTIACDVGEDLTANADRERVVQVLSNLLSNAIKFTAAGSRVTMQARRADGAIEISVSDSGPGISAEDMPHIFTRFWQADRSGAGAGLGLAICKGIIEAHGGRIEAASEPGRGATFRFTLPAEGA